MTVRGEEEDLVRALELGADDYLTKPVQPAHAVSQDQSAVTPRRNGEHRAPRRRPCHLDIEEHTVQIAADEPVRLTKLELRLLQMLLANAGHTVIPTACWCRSGATAIPATASSSNSSCTACARKSKSTPPHPSFCRRPQVRATSWLWIERPTPNDCPATLQFSENSAPKKSVPVRRGFDSPPIPFKSLITLSLRLSAPP